MALQPWSREHIDAVMRLSPRELQMLQALADGRTVVQVAADIHVSLATAKTYVARLYTKLGAHNAANAVDIAYRTGALKVEAGSRG